MSGYNAISGVHVLTPCPFSDERGSFVKVFNKDVYASIAPRLTFEEIFYTRSVQNVIRGFHFQVPPFDLEKVVWVTNGSVLDVLLDLRQNSETFGKCFSLELSEESAKVLYIPKGIAHAFCVLSSGATVLYSTSKVYSAQHDAGIRWDSVGFEWPVKNPILSHKDRNLPPFIQFDSPF